jgi:hypothetical protein
MSAIITGKVFWTPFKELAYQDKKGKTINIKETTAKIVMLAIADSADDYGENSWQSFETIATKASIDRRSVIRVVRALLKHDYLTIAGKTKYGTNNFSINKELLGNPPAKRAKVGRPKIGDSESFIGDSGAKTSVSKSPDPSYIPPTSFNDNEQKRAAEFGAIIKAYEENIGPITPMAAAKLGFEFDAYYDEPDGPNWLIWAFEIAVDNNARSLPYIKKCLDNRKRYGKGWKPNKQPSRTNGKAKPAAPTAPEVPQAEIDRQAAELRERWIREGRIQA